MMMKQNHAIYFVLVFVVLCNLSEIARADAQYKLVAPSKQPYVEICRGTDCKRVDLPILEESASYALEDLRGINGKIVIVKPTQDCMGVNYCSEIYILSPEGVINKLIADVEESLCNVSIHEDAIISSYRDAGKWYNVIYKVAVPARNIIKELEDKCVGCGSVTRTVFNPDNSIRDTWLVTDVKNYWERKVIIGHVIYNKAWLYNTPNVQDKTKMYLVKNDVVVLKKEQISEDGVRWFYFIEYQTKNNRKITKWIETDAVQ